MGTFTAHVASSFELPYAFDLTFRAERPNSLDPISGTAALRLVSNLDCSLRSLRTSQTSLLGTAALRLVRESCCTRVSDFELALDFLDREPKRRLVAHPAQNQVVSVNHGRVIAAEMFANSWERALGQLAAEIHRDLAAERDMLRALFGLQVGQPNVEVVRDGFLNHFDIGLALVRADQIVERLACEIDSDRRFADRS